MMAVSDRPAAAPAHWPYAHRTIAQIDAANRRTAEEWERLLDEGRQPFFRAERAA